MATAIVRARSAAEMPVVTPSRASMETVKAVWWREALCRAMSRRPSFFDTLAAVSARQMRPRPYLAMKLTASGVAICAGDDEIAFVLAVLVIDEDEHAARLRVGNHVLDGGERGGMRHGG